MDLRGDGDGRDTDGDLSDGAKEKAGLVAEDGCEVGEGSNVNFGKLPPALTGLAKTGVRAFKNSVYADGVGMELSPSSSCLIGRGLIEVASFWISEGNVKDLGVFNGWRAGLETGMTMWNMKSRNQIQTVRSSPRRNGCVVVTQSQSKRKQKAQESTPQDGWYYGKEVNMSGGDEGRIFKVTRRGEL